MSYLKREFITFLQNKGYENPGAYCNGLDNVEKHFSVDIDKEFEKDQCATLYTTIQQVRKNPEQIGKSEHDVRTYASRLKKYMEFRLEQKNRESMFSWVSFYEEFATKLLAYKNDRKVLLTKISQCFEELPFAYPFKEQGQEDYDDIDPFTVFGAFNKRMTDENRIRIIEKFKESFAVSADVPKDFSGIPVLMNLSAWFFAYKKNRAEKDIDNLWALFETALAYADGDLSREHDFIANYNQVISQKQIKWNITIGLYWVRPKAFLSLDSVSRSYLPIFNPPVGGVVASDLLPDGEKYLHYVKLLKDSFSHKATMATSFYELSKQAFDYADSLTLKQRSITENIRQVIDKYKANFIVVDQDERYKWEAIYTYKKHWNIEAPDFTSMIKASFQDTYNLLHAGNYYARNTLFEFAEAEPETVRELFRFLYDEEIELESRYHKFREAFKKHFNAKNKSHYQDLHAVSVYLSFEYPEQYYIYKYSIYKNFAAMIQHENANIIDSLADIEKYEKYTALCNMILDEIIADKRLQSLSRDRLTKNCYLDENYHLLAMDIAYFGSQLVANIPEQPDAKTDDSDLWPTLDDYNPNMTKEMWIDLLEKERDPHPSTLKMLKIMLDLGGEATCRKLGQLMNRQVKSCVMWGANLGKRAKYKYKLKPCILDGKEYYFTIPFFWKKTVEDNQELAIWRLRPEIKAALEEMNLDGIMITDDKVEKYTKADFLNEVYIDEDKYNICVSRLRHKKNLILQGAPGVGKTYVARRLAWSMMGCKDEDRIGFVQFHQNYSYEDFIMGYKPDGNGFKLENGIFYEFCNKAMEDPDNEYFFIIDEINRGNMSKIFGELLMLIENDYRGDEITLAYNKEPFCVPENLYIIGMMNTADRSLAMIDYALRRRFSFIEMTPGFSTSGFFSYQSEVANKKFGELINRICILNKYIEDDPALGKGFCIGHSYFCNLQDKHSDAELLEIVECDIIPMLEEYWFDDSEKVKRFSADLRGIFNDKQ